VTGKYAEESGTMGSKYICIVVATIFMDIGSALDGINGAVRALREMAISARAKVDGVRPACSTKSWPCNHVALKTHNAAELNFYRKFCVLSFAN
jgi:hypothetical protein